MRLLLVNRFLKQSIQNNTNKKSMFIPRGFNERSVLTKLGKMVYYTAQGEPWNEHTPTTALVFLHGFGGGSSAYEWSKVYPAFVADYQVLAPDLIGWGGDRIILLEATKPKITLELS
jgi:pimeloyl-ACP methyl ester carboxylesterase